MKTGRNDSCPCGSGKKYKHCCQKADSMPASNELLWRRLKQLNEGLIGRLLDTAIDTFGKEAIYEAWDEFMLWEEGAPGFDPKSPHVQVFWPWFYHHWLPDPQETAVKPGAPMDLSTTLAYLKKNGDRLDPLARRYLVACHEAPFSFHDVVSCDPGKSFVLRDIISGEERHVIEHGGSKHAEAGDILFAQVVVLDGLAELEGCAPLLIPPGHKAPILALRKEIVSSKQPITSALLREYDLEMFGVYHALIEPLLNPQVPELRNTDGDPLVFHKLVYDIDSPQTAFDALKGLALDATDAELLVGAEHDARGRLRKIEFSWLKRGNKQHKEQHDPRQHPHRRWHARGRSQLGETRKQVQDSGKKAAGAECPLPHDRHRVTRVHARTRRARNDATTTRGARGPRIQPGRAGRTGKVP
jgi:SEC-C motif